jgi:hypothetical protein
VDWGKYPYTVPCWFNNGGPRGVIHWTVARPDAPTLPFASAICNLAMELEWTKSEGGLGEVWNGYGRSASWRTTPAGINGDHLCGTEADFTEGGVYDPTAPPQLYGAYGWPVCCYPPVKLRGGAGGGGHVRPQFIGVTPLTGGLGIGGVILVQFTAATTLAGGVGIGGAVGISFTATTALSGGLGLGGAVGVSWSATTALAGGLGLGGVITDTYQEYGLLGTISTLHNTGGPVNLTSNIILDATGSVTWAVSGQTITITGVQYDRETSLVTAPILVTTSVTLTVGAVHVVTASSALTLTLPTGGDKQQLSIVMDNASTSTATISGTVNGVASKVLYKGESAELVYAGSAWRLLNRSLQPMACDIVPSAVTACASGVVTQITLGTSQFDTTGLGMADIANNEIKIQRTGTYQVSGSVLFSASQILGAAPSCFMRVINNSNGDGITGAILETGLSVLTGQAVHMPISGTVQLTAGDKLTLWASQNSGLSANSNIAPRVTFLMAAEIPAW